MVQFFWEAGDAAGAAFSLQLWSSLGNYGRRKLGFPRAGEGSVGVLWPVTVHRATATSMPGLGRATGAKLGVSCRSWQHIWGLVRGAIIALLLDSRHGHKPDQLESDNKTCIDTRKRGLNTGIKDKNHLRHPGKLDFIEQLLSPSSPCNSLAQIWHREADPHPSSCISDILPGKGDWREVTCVRLY